MPNEQQAAEAEVDAEHDDAATATKAPPRREAKPSPPKVDKLPPYAVLLHNDDHNDMVYVIQTIHKLTPLKLHEAMRRMFEAHRRGQTYLLTTHKERAELYRDQFKSAGLTASIRPA